MPLLYFVLLLAGLVCFLAAALNKPIGNLNTVALGLFFWLLVSVLQSLTHLMK